MNSAIKIKVGIGSCLLGNNVRYNGGHKRANQVLESLAEYVEFVPLCPEVSIGLGVPREPIRLVFNDGEVSLKDSKTQLKNHSQPMQEYALKQQSLLSSLCGYVFVKGSPSCGSQRVPRYNNLGEHYDKLGVGLFAQQVINQNPVLPIEDDGRLFDPQLRECFIVRVYVLHTWKQLSAKGLNSNNIIQFWADHKYLVMSRHYSSYKKIGQLLANAGLIEISILAEKFIGLLMRALANPPTRKGHVNVLQHIKGYLKTKLSKSESKDIDEKIELYRDSAIPLAVPLSLLNHQFKRHKNSYIDRQVFMSPYPEQLGLRSTI